MENNNSDDFLKELLGPFSASVDVAPQVPMLNLPKDNPSYPGGQVPAITGHYTQPPETNMDFAMAMKEHIENPQAYAKDKFKYGKNYAYDADYTGHNFNRYYGTPGVYKELGFSPFLDNESRYNDKISWFQDWKRASRQTAALGWTGFKSMLPWNAWDMDITDEKSAMDMERAHSLGASSKKGIAGFFNNLTLDAGYTLGIGAEFTVEEIALIGAGAIATPFTEGGSMALALTKSADNVRKLFKAGELMRNMGTAGRATTSLWEGFGALRSVKTSNEFYKLIKSGKPLEQAMKVLLPSGAQFSKNLYKDYRAGQQIQKLATLSKGAGAFYRDARELAAALSESKMEAGMTEMNLLDELNDDFYAENGRTPNSTESQEIKLMASNAGKETFYMNMPALWLSNKIVFDKMFKGLPGMKTIREGTETVMGSTIKANVRKLITKENVWDEVENTLKAKFKRLNPKNINPKSLVKGMASGAVFYAGRNVTEGLQEQYQDAASQGLKDYYRSIHSDPMNASLYEPWRFFAKNMEKQFTTEQGMTTFLSGFLMASVVNIPQTVMYEYIPKALGKIVDKKGYDDNITRRDQKRKSTLNAFNVMTADPKKFTNIIIENLIAQNKLTADGIAALEAGDVKKYKDTKDIAEIKHIYTALRSGHIDMLMDYLKDIKGLSEEDLIQAFGKLDESKGPAKVYYDKQIDDFIGAIKVMKERVEYIDSTHPNPFNYHKFSVKKQFKEHKEEFYRYQGFEKGKEAAIMHAALFDAIAKRQSSIINKAASVHADIKNASSRDFTILFDSDSLKLERDLLKEEVNSIDQTTSEGKKEVKSKIKKSDLLKNFQDAAELQKQTLKSKGTGTEEEYNKALKFSTDLLKEAYTKYVNHMTGDAQDFTGKLDESFEDLLDYYELDLDMTSVYNAEGRLVSKSLAQRVEEFSDPSIFRYYAERESVILKDLHEKRLEAFMEAYDKKQETEDINNLVQDMKEIGVYFDIADLKKLKEEGKPPSTYYDIITGDPIDMMSPTFVKVTTVLEKYFNLTKKSDDSVNKQAEEIAAKEAAGVELTKAEETFKSEHKKEVDEAANVEKPLVLPEVEPEEDGILEFTGTVVTKFRYKNALYTYDNDEYFKDGKSIDPMVYGKALAELQGVPKPLLKKISVQEPPPEEKEVDHQKEQDDRVRELYRKLQSGVIMTFDLTPEEQEMLKDPEILTQKIKDEVDKNIPITETPVPEVKKTPETESISKEGRRILRELGFTADEIKQLELTTEDLLQIIETKTDLFEYLSKLKVREGTDEIINNTREKVAEDTLNYLVPRLSDGEFEIFKSLITDSNSTLEIMENDSPQMKNMKNTLKEAFKYGLSKEIDIAISKRSGIRSYYSINIGDILITNEEVPKKVKVIKKTEDGIKVRGENAFDMPKFIPLAEIKDKFLASPQGRAQIEISEDDKQTSNESSEFNEFDEIKPGDSTKFDVEKEIEESRNCKTPD